MKKLIVYATLLTALAACSSSTSSVMRHVPAHPATTPSVKALPITVISPKPDSLRGVYENTVPQSYAQISQFGTLTGTQPNVVLYYSAWHEKFQAAFAEQAWLHHAYTLVQMDPTGTTLQSIIAGHSDPYLTAYARAVVAFGEPVIISFAHEMNGGWYSWGTHTPASVYVTAWRRVVDVFRKNGAGNVTWMWTVNAVNATHASFKQWWPGKQYVDWVGIDGYYYFTHDTFASVFGMTVREARAITSDPVLIAETAVGPSSSAAAQVTGLLAGVRTSQLLGLVWFDEAQHTPPYHLDWRLADDPSALTAYKAAGH